MQKLLLLYDTSEQDLARDMGELIAQLNIGEVLLLPLSPDKGLTLEGKEKHYFDTVDGAVFLITPGAERSGEKYPSPSVSHEMGQAAQKFKEKPNNVFYLVDKCCKMPAIDQKTYIQFDRHDIRSIINAITQLFKNMKEAGLLLSNISQAQQQPQTKSQRISMEDYSNSLDAEVKKVLIDLSHKPGGGIWDSDFTKLLIEKYKLNMQDINLLKRKMQEKQVVINSIVDKPYYMNSWFITNTGWEVVKLEVEKQKKISSPLRDMLAEVIRSGYLQSGGPAI